MYILFIDSVYVGDNGGGGSLQCIQKNFDDLWGKRPIHRPHKVIGFLPQLSFYSTSCTGVFYRPLWLWF